jgi:predicted O-linked N-acetylglucosamine transferase (SPINDLY family)
MNEFCSFYETHLCGESTDLRHMFQLGIHLVQSNITNLVVCEDVLYKLLGVFPDCAELCYYMACIYKMHGGIHRALYWYTAAFRLYKTLPQTQPEWCQLSSIENTLDYLKTLFDHGYIDCIGRILRDNQEVFDKYSTDIRWQLFLGAYYIRTNQHYRADIIYKSLIDFTNPLDITTDIEYQILNNALILKSRMGQMEQLQPLLENNTDLCNKLVIFDSIPNSTKVNLFYSNLLIYDYVYHDHAIHKKLAQFIQNVLPMASERPAIRTDIMRKIRIGYVSSDFIEHVVANFIWPIIENHDTGRFEVFLFMNKGYAQFMGNNTYETKRDALVSDNIFNIEGLSTEQAAMFIEQNLEIDILVDLNGFTNHNRLDVFARQPAPIQISYLGFPNTVGSSSITQYRITDNIADPQDTQQWFAERLLRMNRCFLLYKSMNQSTPVARTEPDQEWIVLGALNRESKSSCEAFATWRKILLETSNTKILIKLSSQFDREEDYKNCIGRYYSKLGVDEGYVDKDRIMFVPYGTIDEYVELFTKIDILLDSFPYSGTTTTCNALYNSIPVVTLRYPHIHAHNVSTSILYHCGLTELIADSQEQYVNIVTNLASNVEQLREYRGDGRGTIHQLFTDMMNPTEFMKEYEQILYRTVNEY